MKPIRLLFSVLLSILLMGVQPPDPKIGEQGEGISLFSGNGGPTLRHESIRELQESMPELKDNPLPSTPPMLAPLGIPLGGPLN